MIDTHVHFFIRGLKLATVRRYVPDYDATAENYMTFMSQFGITHAVIVQPSFLGTDNSYMCGILKQYPKLFRGISAVDVDISDSELDSLHADGVVGIRLNLDGLPLPDFDSPPWQRLIDSLLERRWQIEVHRQARDLPLLIDPLLETGINVVVDHFGRPDDDAGVDDAGFLHMLKKGSARNLWVKLSASYRNGDKGRGDKTAKRASQMLVEHLGADRLVWGSDWPHTRHELEQTVEKTIRQFDDWVQSEAHRKLILEDNARQLFHFE